MRYQLYAAFIYDQYPPFDFTTSSADPGGSPVTVTFQPALDGRSRLTVFFRLLLAIPAMVFAYLILIVGSIGAFLAFFVVLITGSWPEGLRSWVIKMHRVSLRLNAYVGLLTDEYPPFSTD